MKDKEGFRGLSHISLFHISHWFELTIEMYLCVCFNFQTLEIRHMKSVSGPIKVLYINVTIRTPFLYLNVRHLNFTKGLE